MPSPRRRNADTLTLRTFRDANKYAVNTDDHRLYVVYSYGPHWPLFIHDRNTQRWYENEDRYGRTTSKHRSQCHPHVPTSLRPVEWMRKFASDGWFGPDEYSPALQVFDDVPY